MTLRACVAMIIALLAVAMATATAGFAARPGKEPLSPLATPTATPSRVTTRTVSDRVLRDQRIGDMPCKTDGDARIVISKESMSEATLRIVVPTSSATPSDSTTPTPTDRALS